jgi:uncharacterized protein (TIGR04141 family)
MKLNIFLIKEDVVDFQDVIQAGIEYPIDNDSSFYTEESVSRQPQWFREFFGDTFQLALNPIRLFSSSAKGVFVKRIILGGNIERIFALTFGYGRYQINQEAIEERFGLKVVLNIVDPKNLRSIDKTTLGSNPKQSKEQISKAGETSSFGIDVEQDLINAVTGKSTDTRLGKTIYGKDSLSASVDIDINEIDDFLNLCFEIYNRETYRENFDWIDQIKNIRNTSVLVSLNNSLIERINENELRGIWMAVPEVVDWIDFSGFKYSRSKNAQIHQDLDLQEFLNSMNNQNISIDLLKSKGVYFVSARNEDITENWSAFRCIYAELTIDNKLFILYNGKWFEISNNFTETVIEDFASIPDSNIDFPEFTHANEGDYNTFLQENIIDSCCMDRQVIIHGGGHSSIEFCDLLTLTKKIIHVKMYSGSSQLSHLFSQGVVSAELFLQDREFRRKLNEKLPERFLIPDIDDRPVATEYEIIYAIISKSANALEIPFFSKVTFRNARRRLNGYGYKVSKKKVVRVLENEE